MNTRAALGEWEATLGVTRGVVNNSVPNRAAMGSRSGALPLVEYITAELAAAGASARTRGRHGPESLTPQERRMAALAAAGQTNREIADQLFVTVKNVEGHLSAAFRKLGIRSRRQLQQFEF